MSPHSLRISPASFLLTQKPAAAPGLVFSPSPFVISLLESDSTRMNNKQLKRYAETFQLGADGAHPYFYNNSIVVFIFKVLMPHQQENNWRGNAVQACAGFSAGAALRPHPAHRLRLLPLRSGAASRSCSSRF